MPPFSSLILGEDTEVSARALSDPNLAIAETHPKLEREQTPRRRLALIKASAASVSFGGSMFGLDRLPALAINQPPKRRLRLRAGRGKRRRDRIRLGFRSLLLNAVSVICPLFLEPIVFHQRENSCVTFRALELRGSAGRGSPTGRLLKGSAWCFCCS